MNDQNNISTGALIKWEQQGKKQAIKRKTLM